MRPNPSMLKENEYDLYCSSCGNSYIDDGYRITCTICQNKEIKSILEFRPRYQPEIDYKYSNLARYRNFLPFTGEINDEIVYITTQKSKSFASKYGFNNLYFTYTGYNEDLGIASPTCSFKDFEAFGVLNRLKSYDISRPLLLSSAGNTARAIAYYAAKIHYPVIIIVPNNSRQYLWLPHENGLFDNVTKYVKIFFVNQPGNFNDTAKLANLLGAHLDDEVLSEGGYFNIGRTCALGICALSFFDQTGIFPNHFVQAVGSGSGPLSALRAYRLLKENSLEQISFHIIQNYPYVPLVESIKEETNVQVGKYLHKIDTACAPMLTSGDPAYNYPGGIYHEMNKGNTFYAYGVTNEEIYRMQYEFWKLEKKQLLLPAAATVAGLIKVKKDGRIKDEEVIQVNITGCGDIAKRNNDGYFYIPSFNDVSISKEVCNSELVFEKWFKSSEGYFVDW